VPWAFADWRRPVMLALGTLLLTFAILVGLGTPFFTQIFSRLPVVGLFRIPSRILPIGTFAITMLAGIGIDKVLRHDWRRTWTRALVITAASATVLLIWWQSPLSTPRPPSVAFPLAVVARGERRGSPAPAARPRRLRMGGRSPPAVERWGH
jgi:hypothetical protein